MSEPKILIALRTHCFNEAVELAFSKLAASRHELVFTVDETNGPVAMPATHEKLAHTTDTFAAMGLPLYPDLGQAMWYNGDYPLFDLMDRKQFDYLFMVENDSVILGDIDALLDRLLADRVEFAVKNFGTRHGPYRHKRLTMNWFRMNWEDPICYGGIFPAVFISRGAIEELRRGRMLMAEQLRDRPEAWLHCEPFAATQLANSGYDCRPLRHYLNVKRCTAGDPIRLAEVDDYDPAEPRLLHPVLVEPTYGRKLLIHYRETARMLDKHRRVAEDSARRTARDAAHAAASLNRSVAALASAERTIEQLEGRVAALTTSLTSMREASIRKSARIATLEARVADLRAALQAMRNRPRGVLEIARRKLRTVATGR